MKLMDMENNADGRIIASGLPPNPSRTDCQNAIINALNAEIVKRHGKFRSHSILPSLINKNQHPLVRETMREMLEKLLQEVK